MTYKIGTRVKKVRGYPENIGNTGIVCDRPTGLPLLEDEWDMYVHMDCRWTAASGRKWSSGTVARCKSSQWEPIIPEGHKPCEEGWSIDNLLSDVMATLA